MFVVRFWFLLYRNLVFVEQAVHGAVTCGSGGPQVMSAVASGSGGSQVVPEALIPPSNPDVDEFLADVPIGLADENMEVDPEGAVGGVELIGWEFSGGLSPVVTRPLQSPSLFSVN